MPGCMAGTCLRTQQQGIIPLRLCSILPVYGAEVRFNGDCWGHKYLAIRGETLLSVEDGQLRKRLPGENAAQYSPRLSGGFSSTFDAGGKCWPFFSKNGGSVQLLKFDVTSGSAAQFSPGNFWVFKSTLNVTVHGENAAQFSPKKI